MIRLLKLVGIGGLALACAMVVVALFVPADSFRQPIERRVEAATGRDFTIAGPMRFTFWPRFGIDLGEISFGDEADRNAPFVAARGAVLSVEPFALIRGEVKATSLHLDGARARFPAKADRKGDDVNPFNALPFGDLRLTDSVLSVVGDDETALQATDLRLRWPAGAPAITLKGEVAFRGEIFQIDALIEEPVTLLQGDRAPMRLEFASEVAHGVLDGSFDAGRRFFEGGVTFTAPSARRLAVFLGVDLKGERGLGEISLAASARMRPDDAHFQDARFTLDGMTGAGDIGLSVKDGRPSIVGVVSIDAFTLDDYLQIDRGEGGAGWRDASWSLEGLKAFDAEMRIETRRLAALGLVMTNVRTLVGLKAGRAQIEISRAALNAGMATGRMSVDAGAPIPAIALALNAVDIDMQSFLRDALDAGGVTGRADVSLSFTGEGASRIALISSLDGRVETTISAGALDGVDLLALGGAVAGGGPGDAVGADDATAFTTLSFSMAMTDGEATIGALTFETPSTRFEGAGTVSLARRALDARLEAPAEPPSRVTPFLVSGPWSDLRFEPDWPRLAVMMRDKTPEERAAALEYLPEERRALVDGLVANGASDAPPAP